MVGPRREVAALRRAILATHARKVDVVTGPNPALNAVDVAATFTRGEDWEHVRATAREHGVTAVLERDDDLLR